MSALCCRLWEGYWPALKEAIKSEVEVEVSFGGDFADCASWGDGVMSGPAAGALRVHQRRRGVHPGARPAGEATKRRGRRVALERLIGVVDRL